jgi:hypothetical protein
MTVETAFDDKDGRRRRVCQTKIYPDTEVEEMKNPEVLRDDYLRMKKMTEEQCRVLDQQATKERIPADNQLDVY